MNTRLIFVTAWALAFSGVAVSQNLLDSIQRLSASEKAAGNFDPAAYLEMTNQALHAWNTASNDEKMRFASKMFLVHFRRAQIMAGSGNFKDAAVELNEEAKMQKSFDGRLEFATKSPDAFFRDLVELQAQVAAETGSDPLANQVGYSFEKDGDGFTASRLELGDDIAGITVPTIADGEAIALIHRITKQGNKFAVSATRWLVVPKGKLPGVLKQATREVRFDTTGIMTVDRLEPQLESKPVQPSGAAPKAASATTNLPSAPKPSPSASVKEAEAKPVKPTTGPSSTSWLMWAAIIIAAICLLWLLLKKRK